MVGIIFISVRYDSDNPRVMGDVGMAGVAIDSVEDMKVQMKSFFCKNRYLVFRKKYSQTFKNFAEKLFGLIWSYFTLSKNFIF